MSVTVLHRTKPKARKEHQCSSCYRTITVGEVYERQDNVFDGARYAYLICEHCRAITNRVLDLIPDYWCEDGFSEETISEGMREYAKTLADLRMLAWFRRRWTRDDGTVVALASAGAATQGGSPKRVLMTHPHDGHGEQDTCRDCQRAATQEGENR